MPNRFRYILLVWATALSGPLLTGCMVETNESTSTISGSVTDELGIPVVGATVTAVKTSQASLIVSAEDVVTDEAVTDSKGSYEVDVADENGAVLINKEHFSTFRDFIRDGQGPFGRHPRNGQVNMELGDSGGRMAARMDANNDGIILQEEWTGPEGIFLDIDSDGDGSLTQEDMQVAREKRRSTRPNRGPFDQDQDGLISRDEWMGPAEAFARLDSNHDGQLDPGELRAGWEARRARGAP